MNWETWSTEALETESARLYALYLEGEDELQSIHEIAEELRRRAKNTPEG